MPIILIILGISATLLVLYITYFKSPETLLCSKDERILILLTHQIVKVIRSCTSEEQLHNIFNWSSIVITSNISMFLLPSCDIELRNKYLTIIRRSISEQYTIVKLKNKLLNK